MARTDNRTVATRRGWIAFFIMAVLAIVAGNYGYNRLAKAMVHRSAVEQLSAVGESKAEMIEAWRWERLSDAYGSAYSPFFREALENWIAAGREDALLPRFQEYLEVDRASYEFADVLLLSMDGQVIVSALGAADAAGPDTVEAMQRALDTRQSTMTDFYLTDTGEGPFLDAVALVPASDGAPLAYILLRNDAQHFLLPFLAQWPTPSPSAEAKLVRRDGDHVLFVTPPRHADQGAMSVRLPMTVTAHPAVQAVQGVTGIVEGIDYRRERVLADVRPIAGTPWFLVTKVDANELLADARFRVRVASIIALLCVLLVGSAIAYFSRLRQLEVYRKLQSLERSERAALEEVRTTLYSIGDAVITTDTSGRIRRMNPLAETLTGWQESEAAGRPLAEIFQIVNETTHEALEGPAESVLKHGGIVEIGDTAMLVARDGVERPISDSAAPILDDSGATTGVVLVFRDQTEEREVERALRESEERFRGLYESAAVGILIHDAETGGVIDANRKAITDYGLETLEQLQAYEMWLEPPFSLEDATRIIRKALTEGPQRTEWKSRAVDGRIFWEEVTTCAAPMDGTTRIISIANDITARKLAEQALESTTAELERFFRLSLDLLCITGSDSAFLKLNDAWEGVLGYPKEDLIGRYFLDFVHPDDMDATVDAMKVLADRKPVDAFVNRYRTKEGTYRFIEWRATCPDGDLIFAAARDITARKAADIERQRLLTLLTEAESMAGMGAWEMDTATMESSWSDELYALHELEKGAHINLENAISFYHPDYRGVMADAVNACIERLEPFDLVCRFVTAKGNHRWIRASGKPVVENGKAVRLIGMFQDITQQRLSEDALERELGFSKRLIEDMADGFSLLDASGITVDSNPAFCEMTGFSREELIGKGPPHPYWAPEEHETIMAAFSETIDQLSPQTYELVFQRRNGERFPALVSPSFLLDAQGTPLYFFATVKDMSERKRAEEERERLLSAIEQSTESIIITDADGMIQYVNPAFERISGYTREEVQGNNPNILKSGEQSPQFYEELWTTITSGETWHGRLRNKRKDGTLFTEDATISPVRDKAGRIVNFVAVKRDIGREEELEAQLRQSQKMDAVGRLAGGIAHDFNNMLGVILGHTEMCLEQVVAGSSLEEDLLQIQSAGKRSAELTRQLLSFARRQTIAPKILNLNQTIEDLLTMLKPLIGEEITIDWKPGPELCAVRLDPSQVDQILMNFAVNARDAIGGVGRIVIETQNHEIENGEEITLPGMTPGRYVVLTFSDNGCGMEPAILERIFEPFFSTKPIGHGTGLGLATVYGIVKQNEGFIEVHSTRGKGTAFRIYLPAYGEPTETQEAGSRSTAPHSEGMETILLVEDEAPLLTVSTRFLERLGYTVLPAPGPREALEIAHRKDQHIDLLLTDVVMPEMTGREVWEHLHPQRPGLKCLFVSGYTADIMADHGVMTETIHFLQKPFTMKDLAAKVREVLGSDAADESPSSV